MTAHQTPPSSPYVIGLVQCFFCLVRRFGQDVIYADEIKIVRSCTRTKARTARISSPAWISGTELSKVPHHSCQWGDFDRLFANGHGRGRGDLYFSLRFSLIHPSPSLFFSLSLLVFLFFTGGVGHNSTDLIPHPCRTTLLATKSFALALLSCRSSQLENLSCLLVQPSLSSPSPFFLLYPSGLILVCLTHIILMIIICCYCHYCYYCSVSSLMMLVCIVLYGL